MGCNRQTGIALLAPSAQLSETDSNNPKPGTSDSSSKMTASPPSLFFGSKAERLAFARQRYFEEGLDVEPWQKLAKVATLGID